MSLDKYLDLISCDYRNKTEQQILEAFYTYLPGRAFKGFQLPMEVAILRGRIWNKVGLPLKIQMCSYPTSIEYYGRCNVPGHSVFYGGEIVPIILDEIEARLGDYIIIGRWDFDTSKEITIAPLIYGLNIYHEKVIKFQNAISAQIDNDYSDNLSAANQFKSLLKYFNNIFLANNHELTGTIAHNLIYEDKILGDKYQCIMYSSVASHGNGVSYAIDRELCKNQTLKPKRFYLVRYVDTRPSKEGYYVLEPSYVGSPDLATGNIYWEEYNDSIHWTSLKEDTSNQI